MSAISQRQRAVSALAVLLLHALLVFAFLHFLVKPQGARLPVAERLLELVISPPRVAAPIPAPAAPRRQRVPVQASPGAERSGPIPSLPPPAVAPDIRGLGQALLGCAPENLSNLTPEQRSHCPAGFSRPDDTAVIEPHSHVKDPARRTAEMAAKNTPMRIPCTSIINAPVSGGSAAVPMVNPVCMVEGAVKGFGPLSGLPK